MAKRIVTRSLFIPRSKPFHDGIPFPPWPEPRAVNPKLSDCAHVCLAGESAPNSARRACR